jgi:hypothetical protein
MTTPVERVVRDTLAVIRPRTFLAGDPDDLAFLGDPALWRHHAIDGLVQEHGERALEVLRLTQDFIERDPSMHRLMTLSGLNQQPDIVVALARVAVASRDDTLKE